MTPILRITQAVATAIALMTTSAFAQTAKPATSDIQIPDIPYTKFVLKNGLTVLVHEDHKAPVVAVNTWYHVGSKNEKPGKTGFAHLFEHLMFSGSENFNHTYINAMERIGATDLNGTTNLDRTNYFETVPTSMLDYTLFAECDRMGHLLGVLDQKKLDLQRGVVQNEKRQGENQPYGVTRQLLTENTYPVGHPYSWTTIGSMQDLDAASMADVQEWFKTNYGPNNVTLVIAGDITPEQARQKVEKYYGEIPPGPPLAKHTTWIAKREGSHRSTVQDRVPQARIYRVWNVPQAYTHEEALLDLAAEVLGGGKSSRLFKRIVYKDQTATDASVSNGTNEIAGQFRLTLTAVPGGDVKKMERAADEELQTFLDKGPTADELQIAKTQILANFARSVERVGGFGGKSDIIARCNTFTGNPDCYKDHLKWIKEATPESVRKAAKEWLSSGDYVLEVQPYPTQLAAGAKLDRSKEAEPGGAESLKLPALQKATLSNGLKIVLAERHNAPVVNLNMLFDAGYAADKHDKAGLAGMALNMLDEGTTTRDSLKLGEEFERIGAEYSTESNLDGSIVHINALKATLGKALELYADVVLHPSFPAKELDRIKNDQLASIRREKASPQTVALRVLPELLYGKDHAYSQPITGSGNEAAVKSITRDDLVKFHQTWFRPNNATLMVTGDITMAELKPQLEKLFGAWKAAEVPAKAIATRELPATSQVYLIDRPGSQQSMIVGAQLVGPSNDPNAVALDIVNDVFGGTFSSRANMNIREDKHWSYGVRTTIIPALGQRPYASFAPVQSDKTTESLQEMLKEYAGVAGAKPIDPTELKEAQSHESLRLPGAFETNNQLGSGIKRIVQYKLPENYFDKLTEGILSLTPDQANSLAGKVIQPKRLVWVIVGDMSKVEAGIRELNIGEVHKIDVDGNPVH